MSGTGAGTRRVSALAVYGVLQGRGYPRALDAAGYAELAPGRQALASELALGALRWHHRHARLLEKLMDRPRPSGKLGALLSVGLFQLARTRVPDHAAVSSCVSAGKALLGPAKARTVNAVLRRYLRERHRLEKAADQDLEGRYSHPEWLIRRLQAAWPGHWRSILRAGNRKPPMWLRVNRTRAGRGSYQAQASEAGRWRFGLPDALPCALRLDPPAPVRQVPGFDEGLVSVQDAGAQLAAPLLGVGPGMRVLDACAAPGGKTAHLLELCPDPGELVAMDIDGERLARLEENLGRLGLSATVRRGDALRPADWFDGVAFDRILLDAPCSTTGVIRRHPDIKHLRRADDIAPFAHVQRRLLDCLWPLLKPGGRLLYSVCSVLPEETGDVIRRFLGENRGLAREVRSCGGVSGGWTLPLARHGYHTLPGRHCADGHFNALLEKPLQIR